MNAVRTKLWYRLHAWLGVGTGLFLLVLAVSGSVIVWRSELDAWLNPHLHQVAVRPERVPLEKLAEAALDALPGYDLFSMRPNEGEGRSVIAYLRQRDGPFDPVKAEVFLDPHTGWVLGRRLAPDALTGWLYKLHYGLFLGTPGQVLVGIFGVTLAASCLTGLCIYRRFLTSRLASPFRPALPLRRRVANAHIAVGLAALAFNLLIAVSGAWFNLPKLRELAAPKVSATGAPRERIRAGVPLDELWRRAQTALPELEPRSLLFPTQTDGPFRVRGGLLGQPLLGPSSSHVLLAAHDGAVAGVRDARALSLAERAEVMLRPLHFGNFGGWPVKVLWSGLGLTPGILALTGGWLWLRRTGRWRSTRAAPAAADATSRSTEVATPLLFGLGLTAGLCLNLWLMPRLAAGLDRETAPPAGLTAAARGVLADWCFAKAYDYFHSAAAMEDYAPPDADAHGTLEDELRCSSTSAEVASEPAAPADWIARFAWHFRPHRHTHLNQGGSDRAAGNLTAEMFPWLWLAIQVDKHHVPSYLEAATWMRRAYGQSHAAEAVLREGLRENRDHPELLLALGEALYLDRDDFSRASVLWHRAIAIWEAQERTGDRPEPFLYRQLTARLALLEERRGELAAAVNSLHKLRRFSPSTAAIDARLAALNGRLRAAGTNTPQAAATAPASHQP